MPKIKYVTLILKWELMETFGMSKHYKICAHLAIQCKPGEIVKYKSDTGVSVSSDLETQTVIGSLIKYDRFKCWKGIVRYEVTSTIQIICWVNDNEQCPQFKIKNTAIKKKMRHIQSITDKKICGVDKTQKGLNAKYMWPSRWIKIERIVIT
eukprot:330008_1